MLGSSTWAASRVACGVGDVHAGALQLGRPDAGSARGTPARRRCRAAPAARRPCPRRARSACRRPRAARAGGAAAAAAAGRAAAPSPGRRAARRRPSSTEVRSSSTATTRVRHDGAGQPRGHVEGAADVAARRWSRPRRPRRSAAGGGSRPRPAALCRPSSCMARNEARSQFATATRWRRTPKTACTSGQAQDHAATTGRPRQVAVGHPALQPAADRGRHEGLRDHPDDAEDDAEQQGAPLLAAGPEQEARRGRSVRLTGVVEGEGAHDDRRYVLGGLGIKRVSRCRAGPAVVGGSAT